MIPIDAIVCISLPHRSDRREALMVELEKAMDFGVLPRLEVEFVHRFPPASTRIPSWWDREPGYYLATKEHAAVLEDLWRRESKLALVLEDDSEFFPDFYTELESFYQEALVPYTMDGKPWEWWCLMIGANNDKQPHWRLTDNIVVNKGSLGCQSYIVNQAGFAKLYDEVLKNQKLVVDETYVEMMKTTSKFLSPRGGYLTGQRRGHSDSNGKPWRGDRRKRLKVTGEE